jgi:hypothetical protein
VGQCSTNGGDYYYWWWWSLIYKLKSKMEKLDWDFIWEAGWPSEMGGWGFKILLNCQVAGGEKAKGKNTEG